MNHKEILASLHISNDELRFILAEFHNGKLNIINLETVSHDAINNRYIVSESKIINAIKTIIKRNKQKLGIDIKRVLLSVPSDGFSRKSLKMQVRDNYRKEIVSVSEINATFKDALRTQVEGDLVISNALLTRYNVDGIFLKKFDPSNPVGSLSIEVDLLCAHKEFIYSYVKCVELSGLEVIDISLDSYNAIKEAALLEQARSNYILAISLRKDSTVFSVLNKGRIVDSSMLNEGIGKAINDISRAFNLDYEIILKLLRYHVDISQTVYSDDPVYLWNSEDKTHRLTEKELILMAKEQINEFVIKAVEYIEPILNLDDVSIMLLEEGAAINGLDKFLQEKVNKTVNNYVPTTLGARDVNNTVCLGGFYSYKDRFAMDSSLYSSVDILEYDRILGSKRKREEEISESFTGRFKNIFEKITK